MAGIQQNQMPEVSLFETRRCLHAHHMKKNLDPVVVLNKSFPFLIREHFLRISSICSIHAQGLLL